MKKHEGNNMARINKSRVDLLVKDPDGFKAIIEKLKAQGLNVKVFHSTQTLFMSLEEERPGFILCSRLFNDTSFGSRFPNFLHRKYKIPVLPISENIEQKNDQVKDDSLNSSKARPDHSSDHNTDVVHLHSNTKSIDILDRVSKFQKNIDEKEKYKKKLRAKRKTELTVDEKKEVWSDEVWNELTMDFNENLPTWQNVLEMKSITITVETEEFKSMSLMSFPLNANPLEIMAAKSKIMEKIKKMHPNAQIEIAEIKKNLKMSELQPLWDEFNNHSSFLAEEEASFTLSNHVKPNEVKVEEKTEAQAVPEAVPYLKLVPPSDGSPEILIEDWMTLKGIRFKLFLWLDKSKKKITYIRTGSSMISESLSRFRKKGINKLHIDKDDFEVYKIQKFIRSAA
jgi:hypothetical protein